MNQGKIHVRYARALFEAGKEKGILPELHHDMAGLLGLCRDSEEFAGLLGNPVIKNSRKKRSSAKACSPSSMRLPCGLSCWSPTTTGKTPFRASAVISWTWCVPTGVFCRWP